MGRADKTHGREEKHRKCWKEERDHLRDLGIDRYSIKMSITEIDWENGDQSWMSGGGDQI
jgi:L-rhamnose mutarotase